MDYKKGSLYFLVGLLFSIDSFSQYQFESELYDCIKLELNKNGFDLDKGLQSFEKQLYEIGYLSDTISIYDALKIQAHCDLPLPIKGYVKEIDVRTNEFLKIRTACFSRESAEKRSSKYFKLVSFLESSKPEINARSVWSAIVSVLDRRDFQHPFYRMVALVTLHSWSLDDYNKRAPESNCF